MSTRSLYCHIKSYYRQSGIFWIKEKIIMSKCTASSGPGQKQDQEQYQTVSKDDEQDMSVVMLHHVPEDRSKTSCLLNLFCWIASTVVTKVQAEMHAFQVHSQASLRLRLNMTTSGRLGSI